jgi:hypothetical protein
MQIRDHYKTMELHPQASPQDIRKAYRRLAHLYHPDKNPDDVAAGLYFQEIRAAYEVLSHPQRRAKYDEERWLAGYARKEKPERITSSWIYSECLRLADHMTAANTYRMSQSALFEYVSLLLSDGHLAVLRQTGDVEMRMNILLTLLRAVKKMEYRYFSELLPALTLIAGEDETLQEHIACTAKAKRQEARWHQFKPWLIVAVALLLCFWMILFLKQASAAACPDYHYDAGLTSITFICSRMLPLKSFSSRV